MNHHCEKASTRLPALLLSQSLWHLLCHRLSCLASVLRSFLPFALGFLPFSRASLEVVADDLPGLSFVRTDSGEECFGR
jgi:hypothetical protein